jgi:hypothetical protein
VCGGAQHGYKILLRFSLGQPSRDEQLLRNLIYYLESGEVKKKKTIKKK